MSKAVLVMGMPESCRMCRFHYPARDMHTGEYMGGCRIIQTMAVRDKITKPDWCPLKPIPEKMKVCGKYPQADGITPSYKFGWNACIDAITGGDDNEK